MALRRLLIFVLLCVVGTTFASEKKKAKAERDSTKNVRFSILGGPGYTPDFGVLIGGSALFTFQMNMQDTISKRSVVPIAFAFLFEGGVNILVRPQLFFKEDKIRLMGLYSYVNTTDNYYGVGYDQNKNTVRSDSTTSYSNSMFRLNPIVLFRISSSDFFIGPVYDLRINKIIDPAKEIIEDPYYLDDGGTVDGIDMLTSGLGVKVSYDTRDIPVNAYKGIYFDLQFVQYASILGSDYAFNVTDFTYSQYLRLPKLGKRSVLSWLAKSSYASGEIPFTQFPSVGSPFDLRGYYKGQFRDKAATALVCEYRHMLNVVPHNFATKMLNRLGFAAWAGVGLMGESPWNVDGVLPNYGVGLRIEVQPRMNFRIDVGRDPVVGNTLLYFNMTEAF
ncbi:BamA/TamA family outer membrane protein [Prolixibacteraceae bacterium]|nr:BamA/TamA family outer membrane protein [Prolixibacteraceae bacterium]